MTTHIEDKMSKPSERKQMTIFRHGEGPELDQKMMPFEGVDEGVMAGFAKLAMTGSERGAGDQTSLLFALPGDPGLSLSHAWFKIRWRWPLKRARRSGRVKRRRFRFLHECDYRSLFEWAL